MEIKAYCIGCIGFKIMNNPKAVLIGPGRKMGFAGDCPICSNMIFTLNKNAYIQEKWGKNG